MSVSLVVTRADAYTRAAAHRTMVAAVARIYEPGHKFDFCPMLESP